MRYLLILIVACSPLAALTGWSLWQAVAGAPPSAADAGQLDTAGVSKRAGAAASQAKEVQPLVQALTQTDLLDTNDRDLPDSADAKLKEAWSASQQTQRLVSKYAKAAPATSSTEASPTARRRQAETALARLHEFISAERQNYAGVQGAADFFALLDRRAKQLQTEIEAYRRKDQVAEALAAVKSDLDQGRYEACLKRMASEPLAQAGDPDLIDELQTLRKRAEYRRGWEQLDRTDTAGGERDKFNEIQAFLRRFPDPPTAAEADLQAQIERRRDRLKSEISVHVLDQAPDLDTLLVEAAQIVANDQIEAPVKQKARQQVTEWLVNRGFPKIESPAFLLGKQEAVTKSGQRRIGIFLLPPGAEQYRFWTDRRGRNDRPRGDQQIPRGALEEPPSTPRYVAWAELYNKEVANLIREAGTRADWQAFADECDDWQRQLIEYREQWGVDDEPDRSCREWSFRDAAATARNVLRHWTPYKQVLGQ